MTFASRTITGHLARGVVGISAAVAAVALAPAHPWSVALLLPLAVLALRGCPMCWLIGLAQTIAARMGSKALHGACVDGSCAISPRGRPQATKQTM